MVYEQPFFADVVKGVISPTTALVLTTALSVAVGLFVLFILHSLSIWLSTDPETAFHAARMFAGYGSTLWNTARALTIIVMKISTRWIPGWNTMAKHMIEPAVNIGIDIMSQVFAHKHFEGLITNDNGPTGVPFRGHYCGKPLYNDQGAFIGTGGLDDATKKFCSFAAADLYAGEVGASPSSDGNNAITNDTLILSTAHARKLQAIAGRALNEGDSMFPAIPLGPLLQAVQEIAGIFSIIQTTAYDIAAHVIYTILSETAVVIFNVGQIIIRTLASVVMSLVTSGALTSLIKSGLDFLVALVVHVALPLLFAGLDLVLCLVNMIQPGTWVEQLKCGTCLSKNVLNVHGTPTWLRLLFLTLCSHRFVSQSRERASRKTETLVSNIPWSHCTFTSLLVFLA